MARNDTISNMRKQQPAFRKVFVKTIDWLTLSVAVIEPLVTIPQVATILIHHTAAGVSLSTWVGYDLVTIIWLLYAYSHKIRVILVESSLFMIVQTAVIVTGLLYGARW